MAKESELRDYGRTGVKVFRLGLGAMRLPVTAEGKVDFDPAVDLIRQALDGGINIIDSMIGYHSGDSEVAIGRAIKGRPRQDFYIQTKVGLYADEKPDDTFQSRLDLALERLGTYVDFYLMHSLSLEVFEKNWKKILTVLERAKAAGQIRHIGFSTHDTPENVIKLIDTGLFECILVQYNMIDRQFGQALAHAHRKGLGTGIMGPVGGGHLAKPNELHGELLERSGSEAVACLRFVWDNDDIDVVFSGMSTVDQLNQNLEAAHSARPLSPAERQKIQSMIQAKEKLVELYCTGCRYCLPCEHGVDIPGIFRTMNEYRVYKLHDRANVSYKWLVSSEHDASQCQQCRSCLEKCPQNIPIIEQLEEAHRTLAPPEEE